MNVDRPVKSERATKTLSRVALFLGELRDGLTMLNMQSAFLITSKSYTEKQAGIMFFIFGMSQFLFQTPAGYIMDYSNRKVHLLGAAAVGTTILTLITAGFAQENGANLGFMVFIKCLQGALTALIPPGLNSITQGIVGTVGMTSQVSMNEMMNHLGTAIIVLTGSVLAYFLYPDIGLLFIVSPIACIGVVYFLSQIRPGDIDHEAARGLVNNSETTTKGESMDESGNRYTPPTTPPTTPNQGQSINNKPSFTFGTKSEKSSEAGQDYALSEDQPKKADTPLQVLRDPTLVIFIIICFCFHMANGTILPLVMQTLAVANGRSGILESGLCIIIAQACMVVSAKICGSYSGVYGRKTLFLIGLFSVPFRCVILVYLLKVKENIADGGDDYYGYENEGSNWVDIMMLSTQVLDGVGAGIFGTMYVLVTSDISGGTGRFSLTLGLTTSAMSIGGTVSGYLGQAIAQDYGYRQAFTILGSMALFPAFLYLFIMPETLKKEPDQNTFQTMPGIAEADSDGPEVI